MSFVKVHRYGVRTYPLGDGRLALEAPCKSGLEVATPPEYNDGIRGVWGSEELLIGSLATCFELTALAIARREDVPIHAFRTDATGHIQSKDGFLRFLVIELDVDIETEVGHEHDAELVATLGKERCIVAGALDVPIRMTVKVHAADQDLVTA
jgi:organic hydroperoxide reductase OsmC/OhrA